MIEFEHLAEFFCKPSREDLAECRLYPSYERFISPFGYFFEHVRELVQSSTFVGSQAIFIDMLTSILINIEGGLRL